MAPSAARPCSTCWLWIPSRTLGHDPARRALLRFLDPSLGTRCPLPPRRARRVHMPVASPPILASPSLKGWPLSSLRFEAESGSLSLRLAPCALQGFRAPVARLTLPAQLHVSQAFHMVNSFQFTREVRLSLTHQRRGGAERKEGEKEGSSPLSPALPRLCVFAALREADLFSRRSGEPCARRNPRTRRCPAAGSCSGGRRPGARG
jgi:hypothetical protein